MIRKLLLLLVLLLPLVCVNAQQASVMGNCFYNSTSERVVVRVALRNNTASASNFELAAIRFAYQYNAAVLTYDGFHSFLYNGSDTTTGLNDPHILNNNFNPELNAPVSQGTRTATIVAGGSKVMTREYFNRSTSSCANVWVVPAHTYMVAFDLYFKFKPGYTPDMYNLNKPGYGFGTSNFIVEFITSHNESLSDAKKEIAVVFILTGQNPEQPFDMGSCKNGSVNPVSLNETNINFISPIDGVLSAKIAKDHLSNTPTGAIVNWTALNNELMQSFEIQRMTEDGAFQTVGVVNGTYQSGTCTYSFADRIAAFTASKVFYRVVARGADGSVVFGKVLERKVANSNQFELYPNPARGVLYVNLPRQSGEYQFRVFDATGRQVYLKRSSAIRTDLQLSHLPAGVYQLEAVSLPGKERYLQTFMLR
jgi:hypothetical protein